MRNEKQEAEQERIDEEKAKLKAENGKRQRATEVQRAQEVFSFLKRSPRGRDTAK